MKQRFHKRQGMAEACGFNGTGMIAMTHEARIHNTNPPGKTQRQKHKGRVVGNHALLKAQFLPFNKPASEKLVPGPTVEKLKKTFRNIGAAEN